MTEPVEQPNGDALREHEITDIAHAIYRARYYVGDVKYSAWRRESLDVQEHFRSLARAAIDTPNPFGICSIDREAALSPQQDGALRALVARWREKSNFAGFGHCSFDDCADELASVLGDAPGATPKERAT